MTLGGLGRRGTADHGDTASITDEKQEPLEFDVLNELYDRLSHVQPTIPDRVSTLLLESAGVRLDAGDGDTRLARLVSLAGQKFLSDILVDAMSEWRLANSQPTGLLLMQSAEQRQSSEQSRQHTATGGVVISAEISTSQVNLSQSESPADAATTTTSSPSIGLGTPAPFLSPKPAIKTAPLRPQPDKRATLTVDCLLAAFRDHGIPIARPPYYK